MLKIRKNIIKFLVVLPLGIPTISLVSCSNNNKESWLTKSLRVEFMDSIIMPFLKKNKIGIYEKNGLKRIVIPKNESSPTKEIYLGVDSIRHELWNLNASIKNIEDHMKKVGLSKESISKVYNKIIVLLKKFNDKNISILNKTSYKQLSFFIKDLYKIINKKISDWKGNEISEINKKVRSRDFIVSLQINDSYKNLFDINLGNRFGSIQYQLKQDIKHQVARDYLEGILNSIYQFVFFLHDIYRLIPH